MLVRKVTEKKRGENGVYDGDRPAHEPNRIGRSSEIG